MCKNIRVVVHSLAREGSGSVEGADFSVVQALQGLSHDGFLQVRACFDGGLHIVERSSVLKMRKNEGGIVQSCTGGCRWCRGRQFFCGAGAARTEP